MQNVFFDVGVVLVGLLLFYQRLHVDLCKLVLFDTKAKNIIKNEKKKTEIQIKV
jgi:hypothetical protein